MRHLDRLDLALAALVMREDTPTPAKAQMPRQIGLREPARCSA